MSLFDFGNTTDKILDGLREPVYMSRACPPNCDEKLRETVEKLEQKLLLMTNGRDDYYWKSVEADAYLENAEQELAVMKRAFSLTVKDLKKHSGQERCFHLSLAELTQAYLFQARRELADAKLTELAASQTDIPPEFVDIVNEHSHEMCTTDEEKNEPTPQG